jgi:spermidine synthase
MGLRIFLAMLILGAYSQVVQALLIREGLVVFYGNEVSLGAFFGSWLGWLAVGSWLALRLRERQWVGKPLLWLSRLMLLLPAVVLYQILLFRLVRLLLDVSASEFVPLDQLFLSLFLITAPGSLLLGIAFPLGCQALQDSMANKPGVEGTRVISRLYIADALGALLGGVTFTFVLVQWLGVVGILGVLTLLLSLSVIRLTAVGSGQRRIGFLWGLAGLVICLPPVQNLLERQLEEIRFSTLQPGLELEASRQTRYGHVALARLGQQHSVVENGQISQSFPLPLAVRQEAAYFMAQASGAKRVLLLGDFAGGLPAELLHYPLQRIEVVEEDARAFAMVRKYLPKESRRALDDPRVQVHFKDGRRFINRLPADAKYDLVLVLDATPANAQSNRYFTLEFYHRIARHLSPQGVFCTQVSGASNYLGKVVQSFTASVYQTLREVLPQVAVAPGDDYVYCASRARDRVSEDADVLQKRYEAMPQSEQRISPKLFHTLLQAEEIDYARRQLEAAPAELNRDARPVTYYLNMLLWGQYSASDFAAWMEQLRRLGLWVYLLPMLVFLALWLLRSALQGFRRSVQLRQSATLSLAVLGMIAMAAQLVVLFSYQAHVGFVFERVALLNGLFMTGLAVGAGLGRQLSLSGQAATRLMVVLLLTALALLALPQGLALLGRSTIQWQDWGYLLLSLLLGLLTGSGFPLGVRITEQEQTGVVRSSGITQMADNLGGALGGLLTGALLVPLLGVEWSSYLLALLALVTLLPLIYALKSPETIPWLQPRGHAAFPAPGLGWLLCGLVLLAFAWAQAQQALQPQPEVQFSERRLAEVSGSQHFQQVKEPFVHYLGAKAENGPPDTVSLASMAAAPEVHGYGGGINLLLAVDREGLLHGVDYLASYETPAYIAGIQSWLDGLTGQDLSTQPLSLARIDALSGATVSSRAALEAINRSVHRAGRAAFAKPFAGADTEVPKAGWLSLPLLVTLGWLLLFFPVYLSGNEPARLAFQFGSLLILGVWLNAQVTEVDLVNLGLGHFATPAGNLQHWLLLGFALGSALLFGPVWCGYLCPFGALQEFISRLGHRLGLRGYPSRPLDRWLRYLKYLLLGLMLLAAWFAGDSRWALFDPMQYVFGAQWPAWILAISGLVLLGALFYYRFWCRYLCPMGAFLALGNKFALLQRRAPQRRFNHCDLGIKEEFDVDCIRCNRCLTGKDTHLKLHRE